MEKTTLLINEIYPAIGGESRFSGWPCTIVRLTGCHLRCSWCDSEHAFSGGRMMSVDEVMAGIRGNGFRTVLVTGGEPLLQRGVLDLMSRLLDDGRRVLLETSGTLLPLNAAGLTEVPADVHKVVDVKAPGSGIDSGLVDWQGIAALGERDEIKIVCAGRQDYQWARDLVREGRRLPAGVRVAFSPVQDLLPPRDLAQWILDDGLEVCLQIQLHKMIWPGVERGV